MRIGEVSRRSGVSVRMLRHYDALGLVRPSGRTSSGYREYETQDLHRLGQVEGLRALGLALAEVGRALDDPTYDPRSTIDELARRTRRRVAEEQAVLGLLQRVDATRPDAWSDVLGAVARLRSWESTGPSGRQGQVLGPDGSQVPTPVLAVQLLDEQDPHVEGALRWELARRGDEAVDDLRRALATPEVDRRRRAVGALVEIEGASATDALVAAFSDADQTVADVAAVGAGRRGQAVAIERLVTMVVDGRHDVDAAEALAVLALDPGPPAAVVDGLRAALVDASVDVRRRVVQALAEVGGVESSQVLAALVDDADRVVAGTAAHVLRRRGPGSAADAGSLGTT